MDNPWRVQVGGNHYSQQTIQPGQFCIRNELSAGVSEIVGYVSRHRDKNGIEDILKAQHFIRFLLWEHFEKPEAKTKIPSGVSRSVFACWHGYPAIETRRYCHVNQLPPEETLALRMVCDFTTARELYRALDSLDDVIARDYCEVNQAC